MGYFIGIDAGGTKTNAVLADETTILGRASGSTIKLSRVGEATATDQLKTLLTDLSAAANLPLTAIARTCLGMAGSENPGHADWARATLGGTLSGEILVCSDAEIALEAAFTGGAGVLAISGTGSVVRARGRTGKRARAGGLGPAVGDEGSGTWIGQQAVRRAMYEHDQQSVSPLLAAILRQWDCAAFADLVGKANSVHPAVFSELAPVVCDLARKGDVMAATVLADAGRELARLVTTAMDRLGESGLPVASTGSILENVPEVRQAMAAALPGVAVQAGVVDPLEGALFLARQASRASPLA